MITGRSRASGSTERDSATARLIGCSMNSVDCDEPGQRRRLLDLAPQLDDALDVVVLLVAVERGAVVARTGIEHGGDAAQPFEVGLDVAAHLQLVVAAAIVGDDLLQGLGQAVIDALRRRPVGRRQRIDQPDRMAHVDARSAASGRRGTAPARRRRCRASATWSRMPGRLPAIMAAKDLPVGAAQRIEDRAVEQRRPVGRHQRIEAQRRAALLLLGIGAGEQVEGVVEALRAIELDGEVERLAELVEVLVVGEFRDSSRTTWPPSASAATPWLVRPSGSDTRTLITACVASVTVITPKRKASRIFTCRS